MPKKSFVVKTCIKRLSSVEERIREKGMRSLLANIDQLSSSCFHEVSFGLYYYFWYSDKSSKQLKFLSDVNLVIEGLFNNEGCEGFLKVTQFLENFLEVLTKKYKKIDVYRANKFLMLFKNLFFALYGLDLSSVIFDRRRKKWVKRLSFFEYIWRTAEQEDSSQQTNSKKQLREINLMIKKSLMKSHSKEGVLMQYVHCQKEITFRLENMGRFQRMNELFLYAKPLLNLLAFTWDSRMKTCLSREFLATFEEILQGKTKQSRKRFGKFMMSYAKSPVIKNENRGLFYDFIEKIDKLETVVKPRKSRQPEQVTYKVAEEDIELEGQNEDPNLDNENLEANEDLQMEEGLCDLEKELEIVETELNENVKEETADPKLVDMKELVKRSFEQFKNGDYDEDEDQDFDPEDMSEVEGDLTENVMIDNIVEYLAENLDPDEEPVEESNQVEIKEEASNAVVKQEKKITPKLVNGTKKNGKAEQVETLQENGTDLEKDPIQVYQGVYEYKLEDYNEADLLKLATGDAPEDEFLMEDEVSFAEMKNRMPEYYFKTPKQKKKYFKKLTQRYKKQLEGNRRRNLKKKRIEFELHANQVKKFKRNDIISSN